MADKRLLGFIASASRAGKSVAAITVLGDGEESGRIVVTIDGEVFPAALSDRAWPEVLDQARRLMQGREHARIVERVLEDGQRTQYVIEVVRPKLSLVVFGGGHVGQAVAVMGALIGYDVTVVDDRQEFLTRSRFPDGRIRMLCRDFGEAVRELDFSPSTAIVIVTRGHQFDELCLKAVVRSKARYIGMIGSKRRVLSVFERLRREGVPQSLLEQVHAPIGIKIGARSPQEIAVAILAEVIQVMNCGAEESVQTVSR